MKIINVTGLVLQFDSTDFKEEQVEKVIDAVNNVLSESNMPTQPQLIRDNVQVEAFDMDLDYDDV